MSKVTAGPARASKVVAVSTTYVRVVCVRCCCSAFGSFAALVPRVPIGRLPDKTPKVPPPRDEKTHMVGQSGSTGILCESLPAGTCARKRK